MAMSPTRRATRIDSPSNGGSARTAGNGAPALDGLAAADARYRQLVEQIPAVTYIAEFQEDAPLLYISPQIEDLLGIPPARWLAEPELWASCLHPDDRERVLAEERRTYHAAQPFDCEFRMLGADGQVVWFWERDTIIRDDTGEPRFTQGVLVDITALKRTESERREAEEQIAYLAYHDSLTGLPNRAALTERLTTALAGGRRQSGAIALLCIDLDDFKLVNDSLGHVVGDELLRAVAARLLRVTRESDFLARQGGDEFIVLFPGLPDDGRASAAAAAERVAAAFQDPFAIAGAEFHVSASVGISLFPRDAANADELLRHADSAMYQTKRAGRNGFGLYEARGIDPLERLSLTARIRKGLAREEFELYYQPILTLADGKPLGVEALIRWRDPERGLVLPGEFIPVAEHSGLIEPIGEWVVDEICRHAARWAELGLYPRLSFNVSPRELRQRGFAAAVTQRLSRHGLQASRFTIEITESTAMRGSQPAQPLLAELHELGLGLAIDDFGAGYSSLSRLREMPVQQLKIDRSFLAELPKSAEAAAVVTAIIQLADALGMETVAEGVETEAQRRFLLENGCLLAQGFHLVRPLPFEDVTALLLEAR
jgi:diguanylate cyclase (GGDEF)-like protein/PAS domain S-box-containing protein